MSILFLLVCVVAVILAINFAWDAVDAMFDRDEPKTWMSLLWFGVTVAVAIGSYAAYAAFPSGA